LFFRDYTAPGAFRPGFRWPLAGSGDEGGKAGPARAIMQNFVRPPQKGSSTQGELSMAVKTATAVKKVRELTEEEILKAPEKDYMNEAQLLFFKKMLLELRGQLLQNADDTGEHLRENEVTTDPSDRATLEEEYTLELRTRDRERKLIRKIDEALKRAEDGTYGYCLETGEEIGIKRLEARPVATLSLEAQERRERRERQYGDRDDRYR